MNKIFIQYYKSPVGELILGSFKNKLCLCDWRYRKMRETIDRKICNSLDAQYFEQESSIGNNTIEMLKEYFQGVRKDFDLEMVLIGTEFQKLVWSHLLTIPYGNISTYQNIAKAVDKNAAVRAVAGAVGANVFSIIIPCHRVIGSNGKLTGYAGGLAAKQKLINIEMVNVKPTHPKLF